MSDFPQELQEEESLCRSMHHLSTAAHHQPSAATNRPSHLSPSSSPEPSSKRLNVNPDSSPSAADAAAAGYTKLSLPFPISFPLSVALWPLVSRTSSEPIKYTAAVNNVQQPSPKFSEVPTSSSPALNLSTAAHHQPSAATKRPSHLSPSSKRLKVNPDSSPSAADAAAAGYTKLSLPFPISFPLSVAPWPLVSRTSSEPIKYTAAVNNVQQPSPKFSEVPTSSRPPLNLPPPSFPFPSLCRKRRLKRILKECVKELSELVNQVVSEGNEEDSETENYSSDNVPKRRLKRILKECMKELSELVNQVVSEGDEEDSETENYSSDNVPKDESES